MLLIVVEKIGQLDVVPFAWVSINNDWWKPFCWSDICGRLRLVDQDQFTSFLPLLNGRRGKWCFVVWANDYISLTSLTQADSFHFSFDVFDQSLQHVLQQKNMLNESDFLATLSQHESYFFEIKNLLFDIVHLLMYMFVLLYKHEKNTDELFHLAQTTSTPAEFKAQATLLLSQKNPMIKSLVWRYELMIELSSRMSHLLAKAVDKNSLLQ